MPELPKWTLHNGDALPVLATMAADSIDAVITDPPYNSGGLTPTARAGQITRQKYVESGARHTLPDFNGDTRDQMQALFASDVPWLMPILGG